MRKNRNVIPDNNFIFFIEFCIYGLHWIISKPTSYSRIIIVNSCFFLLSTLIYKVKLKLQHILFTQENFTPPESSFVFYFLFCLNMWKIICASKLKFEVKIFCINDFSNFQSTFITSFPLHTICGGFIFYSLSIQFKGQSIFLLTERNRAV